MPKEMTTEEAFTCLLQGKKIYKKHWLSYMCLLGGSVIWISTITGDREIYNVNLTPGHLAESNWLIYESERDSLLRRLNEVINDQSYVATTSSLIHDMYRYLTKEKS
jgi:hypothetical protein